MRYKSFTPLALAVCAVCAVSFSSGEARADLFAGGYARATKCVKNCGHGSMFSIGGEVGWGLFAFGLRYGYKDSTSFLFPDLRVLYDLKLPLSFIVTPLVEFSPVATFSSAGKGVDLYLRPGVRVAWAPLKVLAVFLEPIVWDIGFWHKAPGGATSSTVTQGYNFGFGAQFRL